MVHSEANNAASLKVVSASYAAENFSIAFLFSSSALALSVY
jgi:hypothetical protein